MIQNVYFPAPQSVNVGVTLADQAEQDGSHLLCLWRRREQNLDLPVHPRRARADHAGLVGTEHSR